MQAPISTELSLAVQDTISHALAQEGCMPTTFVGVVMLVNADGERAVALFGTPEATVYEAHASAELCHSWWKLIRTASMTGAFDTDDAD